MKLLALLAVLFSAQPAWSAPLGQSMTTEATVAAARTVLPLRRPMAIGRIGRFARLAGMFMGTVDCASVGPMKLRFVLDLR